MTKNRTRTNNVITYTHLCLTEHICYVCLQLIDGIYVRRRSLGVIKERGLQTDFEIVKRKTTRGSQEHVIAHLVFNLTSKVDRK